MADVTLAHLLGQAMKIEFGSMIRADDESDWVEAAIGVINKIYAALDTPKAHALDFTTPELHILDMHLQTMGWKPDEESRVHFITRITAEVLVARSSDLQGERGAGPT